MKQFSQWLNAVTIMIVVVVMADVNIIWLRHPANNATGPRTVLIGCSLILVLLIAWNVFWKTKQKSRKPWQNGSDNKRND